ncbi:hypothetical protein ASPCAL09631 [Aspergillus calidoustus]|uniref:Zn(2)-C6 fungal-type domain-containing protein n=1 Tax=Aspergillus calidoustus TaxID=454130 RepID=A0A0U5G423_ASPCI|nr:hypothetical protein ASPCAL09631 [Aspergillus calidoustus]
MSRPMRRRAAACQTCRKRKVRCDNARPACGFCQANDFPCAYAERGEHEKEDRNMTRVTEQLEKLSREVENIRSLLASGASTNANPNAIAFPQICPPSECGINTGFATGAAESQRDYLQVPACGGSADTILTWPIFGGRFRDSSLVTTLFQSPHGGESSRHTDTWIVPSGFQSPPTENIPALVDRFIQNVHTKNPILDLEALVQSGRRAAEFGLQWDAHSCLVLLACALGSISHPFTHSMNASQMERLYHDQARPGSFIPVSAADLRDGETFFVLACRRIGLLRHSVIGAQCHFFAGVYLMYTFRPLAAWNHFSQASTFYRLRLRLIEGLSIDDMSAHDAETQHDSVARRLEQSLYWSCFKSEVEIRVELPLPQSAIAEFEYPTLFPTPPTLSGDYPGNDQFPPGSLDEDRRTAHTQQHRLFDRPDLEARRHIIQLFDEEQSWYYYLTEVALRRIANRVLNAFYRGNRPASTWSTLKPFIPIALEFESQINAWAANLPPAMQYYGNNANSPTGHATAAGGGHGSNHDLHDSISLELSWAIGNRLLEIRLWLYQPFLYFAIHHPMTTGVAAPSNLTAGEAASMQALAQSGFTCCMQILQARCLRHRHHGIWFDLRALVTASLIVIALVKSGNLDVPGIDLAEEDLRGHFTKTLEALTYWEDEAADIKRARQVLMELIEETG